MDCGDFSFATAYEREMLEDAFQAVTKAGAWDLLRSPRIPGEGGFMFNQNPEIQAISRFIKYDGHSGASYATTMRAMEAIAKNGWDRFVRESIATRLKSLNYENLPLTYLLQIQGILATPVAPVKAASGGGGGASAVAAVENTSHEEKYCSCRSSPPCRCRREKGFTYGWCGVAGGGVPGCDH